MVKVLLGVTPNNELIFANINNDIKDFKITYDLVRVVKEEEADHLDRQQVYSPYCYTVRDVDYLLVKEDVAYKYVYKYDILVHLQGEFFTSFLDYLDVSTLTDTLMKFEVEQLNTTLSLIDNMLPPLRTYILDILALYVI